MEQFKTSVFKLATEEEKPLFLRGRVSSSRPDAPVIFLVPGFLGFMDWGFYPAFESALVYEGFTVISINHSTGGVDDSGKPYSDLESLKYWTVERDLLDLKILMRAIHNGDTGLDVITDSLRVGILAHSKGAAVAALFSREEPDVRTIVAINGILSFVRVEQEKIDETLKRGYLEKQLPGTLKRIKIKSELWKQLARDPERYDVRNALKASALPNLVIQGSLDEKVSVQEANEYHKFSGQDSEVVIFEDTDHNLNWSHVAEDIPSSVARSISLSIDWFRKYLV